MNWIGLITLTRREIERFARIFIQTLVTPWISALLYIFIFGQVVGSRIDLISGYSYIDFVLPGILMMSLIGSAFTQTSSSVYFHRFVKDIEEILVAPLSYTEMILAFVIAGIVRAMLVSLGILVIAVLFSAANFANLGLFVGSTIAVSLLFSLLGILVGLWSNGFEQLTILNSFVIMPLSFVGGVFNSVTMLPESLRGIAAWNPFFYFVDTIRRSMIGFGEANQTIGWIVIVGLILIIGGLTVRLFQRGYGLRV